MAQFTNRATVTYGDVTKTSNQTVGEILSAFTVNKTAVYDVYRRGETVTYIIGIKNTSDTSYNDVTVTDNLGRYNIGTQTAENYVYPLTYVQGSLSYWVNGVPDSVTATATVSDGELIVTPVSVPAGSFVQIGYEARVNEYAPLASGSIIINTVSVTGTGAADTVEASETVTASDELDIEITKALSPVTVSENGEITYTITLSNYGNRASEASDNLILTDTFAPYLNISNVTYAEGGESAAVWTLGTDYTYTADGVFQSAAGKISVPSATYTVSSETGEVSVAPGTAVVTVTGTLA